MCVSGSILSSRCLSVTCPSSVPTAGTSSPSLLHTNMYIPIIGRAGASPPIRTNSMIFLYIYIYIFICWLMRRRIKVADPRIYLVSAAYMHIHEEVVDEYQTIT